MAAAAMAILATVEAATITPPFYPDAFEGNLSTALRVAAWRGAASSRSKKRWPDPVPARRGCRCTYEGRNWTAETTPMHSPLCGGGCEALLCRRRASSSATGPGMSLSGRLTRWVERGAVPGVKRSLPRIM
jgi:hypothetical protein